MHPTPAMPDPFPGEYRFLRKLGEGAFSVVWRADDLILDRPVAIKALKTNVNAANHRARQEALRSESRRLNQFHHPNIVSVYSCRQAANADYQVLQYVPGMSLDIRLEREGPLLWDLAARFVAAIGAGLQEAHRRGIVHKDIKPANILWDVERDEVLLTDFGSMAGTLVYAPPEAFRGHTSPAGDVYSLSATLFHLLTGSAPFPRGEASPDVFQLVLDKVKAGLPNPEPRLAGIPEPIQQLLRGGLSLNAAERPELGVLTETLRNPM